MQRWMHDAEVDAKVVEFYVTRLGLFTLPPGTVLSVSTLPSFSAASKPSI